MTTIDILEHSYVGNCTLYDAKLIYMTFGELALFFRLVIGCHCMVAQKCVISHSLLLKLECKYKQKQFSLFLAVHETS
jgi:hypothetical protein